MSATPSAAPATAIVRHGRCTIQFVRGTMSPALTAPRPATPAITP